ncbi:hypothetical protein MSPP1_002010 [Malassezia sp. CBS 17886]|nr:hypothetical protein MSPP1_002010 [Malassezia sp. CBS 17886]
MEPGETEVALNAPAEEKGDAEEHEDTESAELVRFANADAYFAKLSAFLDAQGAGPLMADEATRLLGDLELMLNGYQEQAYILDPYLERLVAPPADALDALLCDPPGRWTATEERDILARYGRLLYVYTKMERVARDFLAYPGKERDGAGILLGALYKRRDMSESLFPHFLEWAQTQAATVASPFLAAGILQALCAIAKRSDTGIVQPHFDAILSIVSLFQSWDKTSTLVDRLRAKLTGRLALQLLSGAAMDDERLDVLIDDLFRVLDHPDSTVRFSGAKGLARVCAKLPPDMQAQALEGLLDKLTVQVPMSGISDALCADAAPSSYTPELLDALDLVDLHAVSECTWHGVFLALAEYVRHAFVPEALLCRILYWVQRGLVFDIRRGMSTVGSNVRDAACYVLWALARVRGVDVLVPLVLPIAQRLLVVATLDRESLVPHGIAVLRHTDFAAVGIRRHAYLVSAPRVARYIPFRDPLLVHLIRVCLPHWDASLRALAAGAVARIVALDPARLADRVVVWCESATRTTDMSVVHGALLALTDLCGVCGIVVGPRAVRAVMGVSPRIWSANGAAPVLVAACLSLAAAGRHAPVEAADARLAGVLSAAASRAEPDVHDALVEAVGTLQYERTAQDVLTRLLHDWNALGSDEQRAGAKLFRAYGDVMWEDRIAQLHAILGEGSKADVETRRNAVESLTAMVDDALAHPRRILPGDVVRKTLDYLLLGLDDYATDRRGDVGSWVRVACIKGLVGILDNVQRASPSAYTDMLTDCQFARICASLAGHLAERIDSVREIACTKFVHFARTRPGDGARAIPHRDEILGMLGASPPGVFRDATQAFCVIMPLLAFDTYRGAMLESLVRTVGSRSETGTRDAGQALAMWMLGADRCVVQAVYACLAQRATEHVRDNRVFVPTMQTVQLLLDWGVQEGDTAVVHAIGNAPTAAEAVRRIPLFLAHVYPSVRMNTAEQLLVLLQTHAEEEETAQTLPIRERVEQSLLHTPW